MSKITLSNIGSLTQNPVTAQTAINNNFINTIQTAFDNTLSRDGTTPNQMLSQLDMNSNQIVNLPAPLTGASPLRLQDASTLNGGGTINSIPSGGTAGQVLSKNSSTNFDASFSTQTAANVNFTQIGTGAVQRTLDSKSKDFFSIKDFGGVGDGVTDNTTAINSALAALTSTGGIIYFPSGKYRFNSAITFNYPAGIFSVTIVGGGQDNTILYWPNASGGLTLNYAGISSSSHIRDLSFTTGGVNNSNALSLNLSTSVANPALTAISDIYRVVMRGDDGFGITDCWSICVNISNVSNIQIENLAVYGPSSATGVGINLIGLPASSSYSVVYNIAKSTFYNLTSGILYGSFIQGVTVDQSNFQSLTGSMNAIVIPASQTGTLDQLVVTNSQFQVSGSAIGSSTNINHLMLTNNLFYLPANGVGINLQPATGFVINGNYVTGLSTTGTFGINLAANSTRGNIINNVVSGCGTGINVQAGTTSTNIAGNTLASNTTAIGYAATGTTNTIVNNPGYNPGGTASISVGASPFTYTAGPSPETVYINGGTISVISVNKVGGSIAGVGINPAGNSIDLGPNEQVNVTYSAAPGMNKMIH